MAAAAALLLDDTKQHLQEHKMELWEQIIEAYPEISATESFSELGIELRDDSDGAGAYISKWSYSKPIPQGLKLGK